MDSAKNALAAALLRSVGRLRIAVVGSSMLPAVRPHDLLLVRRCTIESARVGDIAVFTRDERLFAHRVIATGPRLHTRGDALAVADPPVDAAELLGRVVRVVRRGRVMRPPRAHRLASALFRRSARAGRMLTRLEALRRKLGA